LLCCFAWPASLGNVESGRTKVLQPFETGADQVRRVEDITEALWGTRVWPSTVSDLNKKIYGTIEA
jgi:hypothetical protein